MKNKKAEIDIWIVTIILIIIWLMITLPIHLVSTNKAQDLACKTINPSSQHHYSGQNSFCISNNIAIPIALKCKGIYKVRCSIFEIKGG